MDNHLLSGRMVMVICALKEVLRVLTWGDWAGRSKRDVMAGAEITGRGKGRHSGHRRVN